MEKERKEGITLIKTPVVKRKNIPDREKQVNVFPDHIHGIWTLPENDNAFSMRWRLIKNYFSRRCKSEYKKFQSASRQSKGEQEIWQRRFWEHQIRNGIDFTKHVEYIHFNPAKHRLVKSSVDWPYSSFHRHVKKMWDMNNLNCWVSLCSTQPT